eukprot:jgi/Pico_ML_1/53251/g3825.t1
MVQDRRFSTISIDRIAMAHAFASIARALFLLSVSWIASSPLVRAGDPGEAVPGVLDLLPTTFDGHLDGAKHALVEFYAPYVAKRGTWCGHCKRMAEDYAELGRRVQSDPRMASLVTVAKVDASAHGELGQRFGVKGFPTVLYFPRGEKPSLVSAETYAGGRNVDAFHAFLQEKVDQDVSFARVEELDDVVQAFLVAGEGEKGRVLQELEGKADALQGQRKEHGAVYVRMAKKAMEKGVEYFDKERERVERMVESGQVGKEQMAKLLQKASVLTAFQKRQEGDAGASS